MNELIQRHLDSMSGLAKSNHRSTSICDGKAFTWRFQCRRISRRSGSRGVLGVLFVLCILALFCGRSPLFVGVAPFCGRLAKNLRAFPVSRRNLEGVRFPPRLSELDLVARCSITHCAAACFAVCLASPHCFLKTNIGVSTKPTTDHTRSPSSTLLPFLFWGRVLLK